MSNCHRIIESLRLEKTSKTIKPNRQPILNHVLKGTLNLGCHDSCVRASGAERALPNLHPSGARSL